MTKEQQDKAVKKLRESFSHHRKRFLKVDPNAIHAALKKQREARTKRVQSQLP